MIAHKDQFHSENHYNRYLFAVNLAKQINEFLDKGYIIIENNEVRKGRFVFVSRDEPIVGIKEDSCTIDYICGTYNDEGQTYIEHTKNQIKTIFSQFKIIDPKDIKKIKYKENK